MSDLTGNRWLWGVWQLSTAIILAGATLGVEAFELRGGGVLKDGASEHRLKFDSYSWVQDERAEDLVSVTPSARYGIAAGYDLQIGLPLRQYDERRDLHGVDFALGFPLAREASNADHVTLTAHGRLLPSDDSRLGSGSRGLGLALHIGERLGDGGTRVDGFIGLARTDVAYSDREGYEAISQISYASRLEQELTRSFALSAELETHLGLSGEELQNKFALYLRPGIRWSPTSRADLRLVYGSDMVAREVAPQSTLQLSFVYTPEPRSSRQSLTQRIERLEAEKRRLAQHNEQLFARTAALRRDTEALSERLTEQGDELRNDIISLRTTQAIYGNRIAESRAAIESLGRRSGVLRIEVVNRSGERAPANRLITELERQGHRVVRRIERIAEPVREDSEIHYREGFGAAATNLGEILPGSPQVSAADPEIPRGANVRIIVGADLPGTDAAAGPEPGVEDGAAEDNGG